MAGRSTPMTRRCRANAVACGPSRPLPVKPWMSSSGPPAGSGPPSARRRRRCALIASAWRRRRRRPPRDAAPRSGPGRSESAAPGRRAGRSRPRRGAQSIVGRPRGLAAERRPIGPTSMPWGVPNSSSKCPGRPDAGRSAVPWAGTRRCRHRRCRPPRSWPTGRAAAPRPGRSGRARTTHRRPPARPARRPPRPPERGRDDPVDTVDTPVGSGRIAGASPGSQSSRSRTGMELPPTAGPLRQATRERRERQPLERLVGCPRREPRRSSAASAAGRRPASRVPKRRRGAMARALARGRRPGHPPWPPRRRATNVVGMIGRSFQPPSPRRRSGSAPRRVEQASASLGRRRGPEADDQVRQMLAPRPRADEVVATGQDDCDRSWRPQRRPDSASATIGTPSRRQPGERGRQPLVHRTDHDEPRSARRRAVAARAVDGRRVQRPAVQRRPR